MKQYQLIEKPSETYSAEGEPIQLGNGKLWLMRARGKHSTGILIFTYQGETPKGIVFLNADEAVTALATIGAEMPSLIEHMHPEISDEHRQTIEIIRSSILEQEEEEALSRTTG